MLDVKSRLSRQHILSQLETAAQYLTYSMCQFEALGVSSLLKLLVTRLWPETFSEFEFPKKKHLSTGLSKGKFRSGKEKGNFFAK